MKLKDTIRFIKKYFSKQKKLFIKSFILLFFSSIIGVSFGYLLGLATENVVLLADYIKSLYTSQGSNGLYYHTSSLANSATDNSYRYAGANPNNYVCFGSTASTCPSDNLYRIIGVFGNQVKLIKNTRYGMYAWDSGGSNTWSSSTLNTGTLNGTYISGLSSTTYSAKIGLMYVSDYGFAASLDYWTTELYNYEPSKSSNWMYLGGIEWTISRGSNNSSSAFYVGFGDASAATVSGSVAVRPVFYLTSSTQYVSGSGTQSDPIRIN